MNDNPHKIAVKLFHVIEVTASGTIGIVAAVFVLLVLIGGRGMAWWSVCLPVVRNKLRVDHQPDLWLRA
jgi:hypothetical protein